MAWQYHPVLILFVLGGFISLVVAGYCWRHIQTHGWSYLVVSIGLLGFNNAIWVFAATLKTASTDLLTSLVFYKLEFLGVLPNTAVAIVFAITYVGKDRWLKRSTFVLLSVVPTVFILLALVNPNNMMISDPKLIPSQGILAFEHEFPPLFDLYLAWIYGAVLVAILIISWGVITDRVPTAPVLVGIVTLVLPLVTAMVKTAGIYPPGGDGINVSPAASAIGISVLAFAVMRYRVFELVPVGRDRAIEVMADGYLLVGPNKTILDLNPAAAELLVGHSTESLRGISVTELVPVYDTLTETNPVDYDTGERVVEIRCSDVTRQEQDAGEVLLLRDVTTQRQQKRELERTNERLDKFAGMVSHDLINPLHTAEGYLELARETDNEEAFEKVSAAHDRMATMIDELLTLARTESEIDETDMEPVALESAVAEAWETAETGGASLNTDIPPGRTVAAVPSLLGHILENLFRNAADHNEVPVTVTVGMIDDEGFYVADDGGGIAEATREEVFEHGYTTNDQGTGFGLSIVQDLVTAHGWTITLTESAEGGARFEITGLAFVK